MTNSFSYLEPVCRSIEPFNFIFFIITGWGIELDYCYIEWFALETNRDHSVVFEIAYRYCIEANIATTYLTVIMSIFGFELSSPDIPMPGGAAGVVTSIIRIVVVAAIAEELTLRGYVMGNLRKYGDRFAIIVSSVVFAIMHGNLIQAPFALIAGFGLGYFAVKTGTVWTAVAIHAANNFISTAISYAMDYFSEEFVSLIYAFVLYGFIFFGLIALWLLKFRNNQKLRGDCLGTSDKDKMKAFFLNPAMITALVYMIYITTKFVSFNL